MKRLTLCVFLMGVGIVSFAQGSGGGSKSNKKGQAGEPVLATHAAQSVSDAAKAGDTNGGKPADSKLRKAGGSTIEPCWKPAAKAGKSDPGKPGVGKNTPAQIGLTPQPAMQGVLKLDQTQDPPPVGDKTKSKFQPPPTGDKSNTPPPVGDKTQSKFQPPPVGDKRNTPPPTNDKGNTPLPVSGKTKTGQAPK